MMKVANPIYDIVFKYLMEDERIAKTILFDQSHLSNSSKQVLDIDENLYAGDDDMLHIMHRLMAAASDSKMRHEMNVEDEYYSVIEKRDTTIMLKDREIAEKSATILEQGATIQEQETLLRSTVKLLIDAGMTPNQIAANLGVPRDKIDQFL